MSFLAANTQDGFGEHGDKKYPMCTKSKNQAYIWPFQFSDLNLKKHQHGAVNLKGLE